MVHYVSIPNNKSNDNGNRLDCKFERYSRQIVCFSPIVWFCICLLNVLFVDFQISLSYHRGLFMSEVPGSKL